MWLISLTVTKSLFDAAQCAKERQDGYFTMKSKTLISLLFLLLSAPAWADETWETTLPECSAKLERRTVEPDAVIVRTDCPLSLQSLAQILREGFRGLFPDHSLPIHGIYLGRLMDYPEWSQALAKVAAKSPSWNAKCGRPSKIGENDNHVVRVLLSHSAYPEPLKSVFAEYELNACIADVEKVLVFDAKTIFPTGDAVFKHVSPRARLPVDAQIWLILQPLSNDCRD
jgi:hypothetical protein